MNIFLLLLRHLALAVTVGGSDLPSKFLNVFGPPPPPISSRGGHITESTTSTTRNCELRPGEVGECVSWGACADKQEANQWDSSWRRKQTRICGPNKECCTVSGVNINTRVTFGDKCGLRNFKGIANIESEPSEPGTNAAFGEFPWMVAILKDTEMNGSRYIAYKCGGSLLHPRVVLTAADCIFAEAEPDNLRRLRARAGDWNIQSNLEYPPYQDRLLDSIIMHEEFNQSTLANNIALLYLAEPFDLADNVQMVCLPAPTDIATDGTHCVISGWGKGDGVMPLILKKVEQPVIGRDSCTERLRKTQLGLRFTLHNSFMCAGGRPGIDDCQGDGGSPLVCPVYGEPSSYIQHGISAWGIGCNASTPTVYTALITVRQWIDAKLRTYNIDTTAYTYV